MNNLPNNPQINIEGLKPFRKFCMTIGALPSSYLESLTYQELLLWFCNYLQNTVIPAVNNNAEAVEELQNLYVELKNYVDNYFTNLDVQEQINNKLDEMVESGYFNNFLSNYIYVTKNYNTTQELLNDETDFIENQKIKTYGYYTVNDGGNSDFIVTSSSSEDYFQLQLKNGMFAQLISQKINNAKQFGVVGDNETDDTENFINAIKYSKNLIIPKSQYKVDYIRFKDDMIVDGQNSTFNCYLASNATVGCMSNTHIKNIIFNSTNINKEWARTTTGNNVIIENCTFSGFSDQTVPYNAWGIHFSGVENVKLINCKFENNSFQDLMIYENCKNLIFENCYGTHGENNGIIIDIEPANFNSFNDNIIFNNCIIYDLLLLENQLQNIQNRNINFNNCSIETLRYDGSNVIFNNCIINNFKNRIGDTGVNYLGSMLLLNSGSFGKNLIKDEFLNSISNKENSSYWKLGYSTDSPLNSYNKIIDNSQRYTVLNPLNKTMTIRIDSKKIKISSNISYLISITGRQIYKTMAYTLLGEISYYDNLDNKLLTETMSLFRNQSLLNNTTNIITNNGIINPPNNSSYCIISLKISNSDSQPQFAHIGLYELNNQKFGSNNLLTNYTNNNIFYGDTIPNPTDLFELNYQIGDIMLYDNPTDYIGAICTEAGRPGTWKKFGSIEN